MTKLFVAENDWLPYFYWLSMRLEVEEDSTFYRTDTPCNSHPKEQQSYDNRETYPQHFLGSKLRVHSHPENLDTRIRFKVQC